MNAGPRALILNLLLGAGGAPLGAREAVAACALMGVQEGSTRVALARLVAAGMLQPGGRGLYTLGAAAQPLAADVATWRAGEQRVRPWLGDWVAVHAGALGRSDRAALRSRERALDLLGLAELERGLYLRPDNLAGGVAGVRARLASLCPQSDLTVFVARDLGPTRERDAHGLWDGAGLNHAYAERTDRLDRWLAGAGSLSLDEAARESLVMGHDAIHALVFDPLLPEPMVNTTARAAFADAVRRFDAAGQLIWQQFLAGSRRTPPSGPAAAQLATPHPADLETLP